MAKLIPTYTETRCAEILAAAAEGDLKRLLQLIPHHLREASERVTEKHREETYANAARDALSERISPVVLALEIIAQGGFDDCAE